MDNGTYYVCVTADDGDGRATDATNNGFAFTVAVAYPAPFAITGPLSPVETETPIVTWEASANATGYDMIVATDVACTNALQSYTDLAVTSQLIEEPMANGTYYVCVTAFDNYNHELVATNNGYAFNVLVQPPGPFMITAPMAPVNAQTATIAWQASERAIEYDLAVSTASDCSAPIEEYVGLTVTSQETGYLANGIYYACVTARDDEGRTTVATNNGFSFEMAYVPPKEHLIFITMTDTVIDENETFPPNSPSWGGLVAADYLCTEQAFYAGLLATWDYMTPVYQAVLSTPTVNARDRLVIEGEIKNMAGDIVASSAAELWSSILNAAIQYDEYGQIVRVGTDIWTGTFSDGTWSGYSCDAWNSTTGTATGGHPDILGPEWIQGDTIDCGDGARLYGISPPFTASDASFTGPGAPGDSLLTEDMIEPVLQQAMAYWAGQGIDTASLSSEIGVAIANLGGTQLAMTTEGIDGFSLDRDAAEWGWSTADTVPADRIDLLSATVHEMGHLLGLEHTDPYDVMAVPLPPGTRPLGTWPQATGVWAATVNYGDGSGTEPLTLNPDKTFGLAHNYADNGIYTVSVEITDPEGLTSTDALTVTVNNVAPFAMLSSDTPVDEGSPVTVTLAYEADPSPIDTAAGFHYSFALDTASLATTYATATDAASTAIPFADDGTYTVYARVFDKDDGFNEFATQVLVNNVAPTLVVDTTAVVIEEGHSASKSITTGDVPADTVSVTASLGNISGFGNSWTWTYDGLDDLVTTQVTITASDEDSGVSTAIFNLTVNNVAPEITTFTAMVDPVEVGNPVDAHVEFTDPGLLDTHTVTWDWGDGSTLTLQVLLEGLRHADATYPYSDAGVYTITVKVEDEDAFDSSVFQYVVVYDPSAGFVTGGGWIDSPEHAYAADPTLTGKANFGFLSKYKKGAEVPTGQTEFQFKLADLNFHSSSYQWLVVAGSRAQYKGEGTINGDGEYGFMLTAIDADLTPSTDVDEFQIKIWNKITDAIVYDNGLSPDDDAAGTKLGGGSIVIHDGGKKLHATDVASVSTSGVMLTQEALKPAVDQAISYWSSQQVGTGRLAALRDVDVHMADFSGSVLGIASSSNLIWIDRDAAGYGWSGPTRARGSTVAGMDLLWTVTHELGHKLGFEHGDRHAVMAAILAPHMQLVTPPNLRLEGASPRADAIAGGLAARTRSLDHLFSLWGQTEWPDKDGSDVVSVLLANRYVEILPTPPNDARLLRGRDAGSHSDLPSDFTRRMRGHDGESDGLDGTRIRDDLLSDAASELM
jgi:hypothetical protein